jgi:hypothetical protein
VVRGTRSNCSPNLANEVVGLSQASVDGTLLWLLGPKTPACNWYFQYLLPGTNPSVLNRHMQGLPHRNLRIGMALSLPLPFDYSTDPPNDPAQSQIIHTTITKIELEREHDLNLTSGSLNSTSTIAYHLSIALLMVSHHKMGATRINRKVSLNATTVSTSSYRLNAQSKYRIKSKGLILKEKEHG